MKQVKRLVEEDELQEGIAKGAYQAYKLAKAGYGPKAGNAMLEQIYGDPLLSRDGITNIRRFFAEDPVENMTIRAIVQASSQSNKNAGDGTTATVILVYYLYTEARKLISAGYNRMEVATLLQSTAIKILNQLDKLAKPFNKNLLKKIAEISSGSDSIGEMLTEIFKELGMDAHVLVEDFGGDGIFSDIVDGFYFNKGFVNVALANDPSNLESRHFNAPILMVDKPLKTVVDIAPLMETLVQHGIKEVVLIAEVAPEALEVILMNRLQGIISIVPVEPPVYEGLKTLFLDDLALVTGGQVYGSGNFIPEDTLGFAEKVIITGKSTTIIGGDGNKKELKKRIFELKEQLKEATDEIDVQNLKERIGRLSGKLAIIRVGAPTEIEQKEIKLRIEDAVCAIQAAPKDGVLPGGAVALARVKADQFEGAYKHLLKDLADNAGHNPEKILNAVEQAPEWHGYNFKNMTKDPVNLLDEGVLDPCLIIKEIVRNATSIASSLITSSVGLVLTNRDDKAG